MADPRLPLAHGERRQIVESGYDALAPRWTAWAERVVGDPAPRFLTGAVRSLRPGARVVDLGCGQGGPWTENLARRVRLTGVDFSAEQLRYAAQRITSAEFVRADFVEVDFEPGSIELVTAFYSLTHLGQLELAPMLRRVARWLAPGGRLLASLAVESGEWEGEWLGTQMFFGGWDREANVRFLDEAGLTVRFEELVAIREPEGPVTFLWVIAEKAHG